MGIDSVVETDKKIVVTINETSPEPGSMVIQAFINPFGVVKINSNKDIILM